MKILEVLKYQWDRAIAVLSLIAGVIAVIIGWHGVSNTGYFAEQMPYLISAGLTAILLFGVAGVLYISADLRDEWRKLADIHEALEALRNRQTETSGAPLKYANERTVEAVPPRRTAAAVRRAR